MNLIISGDPSSIVPRSKESLITSNTYEGLLAIRGMEFERVVLHKLKKHEVNPSLMEALQHIRIWQEV